MWLVQRIPSPTVMHTQTQLRLTQACNQVRYNSQGDFSSTLHESRDSWGRRIFVGAMAAPVALSAHARPRTAHDCQSAAFNGASHPCAHHPDTALQSGVHLLQRGLRFFAATAAGREETLAPTDSGHWHVR